MGYLETHIPKKPILRWLIDRYKERKLYRFYSDTSNYVGGQQRMIIYMADGRMKHGGLADRICGMVSAYNYCKKNHLIFKIYFVSPYGLSEFLKPAIVDWIIGADELSYDSKCAQPLYLSMYSDKYEEVEKYFSERIGRCKKQQIHLYTNAQYFQEEDFPSLFSELFEPSITLQNQIDMHLKAISDPYVSITFRFQQLLGDFKEDGFPILKTDKEKMQLIELCINCITSVRSDVNKKILVTSDSTTFLKVACNLEGVYVVHGNMRHLDYGNSDKVDISVDMKSFVDFFLLAHADKLFLYANRPLYNSGFPRIAALVNSKPFEIFHSCS